MNRNRLILLLAAAFAIVVTATGTAGAAVPDQPGLPVPILATGVVHAGEQVELCWRPSTGHIEELELLLSLDGGRSWRVRVSPELPGATSHYRWRVPNLASSDARIRLRVRIDGREVECEPGERFTIEADPSRALDGALFSEGTWWRGCTAPPAVASGFADGDAPGLSSTHRDVAGESGPRLSIGSPIVESVVQHQLIENWPAPQGARAHPPAPQEFPLRN